MHKWRERWPKLALKWALHSPASTLTSPDNAEVNNNGKLRCAHCGSRRTDAVMMAKGRGRCAAMAI
jgi:hypothetical protein